MVVVQRDRKSSKRLIFFFDLLEKAAANYTLYTGRMQLCTGVTKKDKIFTKRKVQSCVNQMILQHRNE